ncbi:hypothetical protein BN1110_01137 [bacterium YEK0313]|nr:hypothetical protein BN1110_01137 [bacterium YEK0313]
MRLILVFLVAAGLGAAFVTFCTVLVTPAAETGTVGKTEIVERRGRLRFLDSPEALCRRSGMVASTGCGRAAMAAQPPGRTYLTLPYVDFLYQQTLN